MARIPVAGPWITQDEIDAVTDAATHGWYTQANGYTARFESAFAAYVGVKHAVALPSCTSAIHLALAALGVGPGDEVIVPDITWIATAAPALYVGATPVFADIDPRTWCLSVDALEACITPRTRAVIPVDLYGGMPDWDALRTVCARHGLPVIEDAAEAIGARHRGRPAGSLGDVGVFSFHGTKTLTTGEGGMLVTNREDVFNRVLVLRDHGRAPGDRYFFNEEVGFKYRMSAMQAALGHAQLHRVNDLVARKRDIHGWYREVLGSVDGVCLNVEPPETVNPYWMTTAVLDPALGVRKDRLMAAMDQRGVDTRPFFHPLSSIPAFVRTDEARRARARNRDAYAVSPYGINLPSALVLTRDDVHRAAAAFRDAVQELRS